MLNIYFGDMPEAVYNTSVYFNYTYEDEWLTSDFAKEVIKKIDKSDVKGPHAVESPVLGVISPEKLSGGTKTLLLMANDPEKVFNASTCGDNCAPFILKLAKKKDLTINLRHLMDFGKKKFPVDVKVLNTGDVVHSMEELMPIAFQFVGGDRMKGKHKIEVRSGRVVFTIELERNITILRGDSATGKTTLVEMLQAYETYGRQSGVTVSCDKPCRVLSGVNWELQLNATHDSIVFVDEGSTFVSSLDFARAIQHSDNYYVLVTREDLSTLPYSVNAILELKKTTSRFKRTYNKAYPIYDSLTASNVQLEGVEKLLTEDANSGYQLFTNIGEKYGIVCISAAGKDNIKQKILLLKSEKVLVIADGAAFGPQMNDIYRLMQEDNAKFSLYLPESLEWLLLKADLLGQPDILEILQHPADFIESSEFFSWERFFTNLLEQRTKDISYMRYDKAKLPEFYLQEENLEKIIAEMG